MYEAVSLRAFGRLSTPVFRLTARHAFRRTSHSAAHGLLSILLCAGCVGPFRGSTSSDSCGTVVSDDTACDSPACTCCDSNKCCHDGFVCRTVGAVVHTACLPYRICCRAVNFCAPDGMVGPPDVAAPDRFHPVPTRPVFVPVPAPLTYPAEFSTPSP